MKITHLLHPGIPLNITLCNSVKITRNNVLIVRQDIKYGFVTNIISYQIWEGMQTTILKFILTSSAVCSRVWILKRWISRICGRISSGLRGCRHYSGLFTYDIQACNSYLLLLTDFSFERTEDAIILGSLYLWLFCFWIR